MAMEDRRRLVDEGGEAVGVGERRIVASTNTPVRTTELVGGSSPPGGRGDVYTGDSCAGWLEYVSMRACACAYASVRACERVSVRACERVSV
eukprot:2484226-Pleurochrysis_carterae.AAC.5